MYLPLKGEMKNGVYPYLLKQQNQDQVERQ